MICSFNAINNLKNVVLRHIYELSLIAEALWPWHTAAVRAGQSTWSAHWTVAYDCFSSQTDNPQ